MGMISFQLDMEKIRKDADIKMFKKVCSGCLLIDELHKQALEIIKKIGNQEDPLKDTFELVFTTFYLGEAKNVIKETKGKISISKLIEETQKNVSKKLQQYNKKATLLQVESCDECPKKHVCQSEKNPCRQKDSTYIG